MNGLKNTDLLRTGFIKKDFPLPPEMQEALDQKDWEVLDSLIKKYLESGGLLYNELISHHLFNHTEHIIAIRQAETDEDGIWHDDGSRHMAFTWSLNESPDEISGGELLFCKRPQVYGQRSNITTFTPPLIGTLIIFLTGEYGFEHKVNQVIKGERKTIAGWCSTE